MHTRHIAQRMMASLRDTPVVLIHGARQTGKTTLAKSLETRRAPRRYITLDDATSLASATADAGSLIASIDQPSTIDEAQRAPGRFMAIKASVDARRDPGRFLLTGSANVLLLPALSESPAGRIEVITLWPLSQGEIEGRREGFIDSVFADRLPAANAEKRAGKPLGARILGGGYPEPLTRTDQQRRDAWFASYISTILYRDVRDIANIDGLTELPRLLSLLASRVGGLLNFADISRGLSMPQSTLKRYFTLLETIFLVVTIPAWSSNLGLRLTKSPKIMLADTGLAAHLLGMNDLRLKADGHARGHLLENFVAMEIMKQTGWSEARVRLFHFRTTTGQKVDLVLEDAAGRVVGIEVKSSSGVASEDFRGLRALRQAAGAKFVRGIVLHDGDQTIPFERDLVSMPVGALWTL